MKVCIYGAGAIGGFIGTRLAATGQCNVAAVARGATLQALRAHGWRLRQGDELLQAAAQAVEDPRELGVMDLVVVAVKGPALAEVARRIAPLLGAHTLVLPAMNGVPWWFAQAIPALGGQPLRSVDPDGAIAAHIPLAQVVGCVVHASTFTPEPGVVEQRMGQGLIIGESGGGVTPRVQALADLLARAGFDCTPSADVRQDIWYKLWGNMTMNPVSAITGATVDRIMADPLVLAFCSAAMQEAAAGRRAHRLCGGADPRGPPCGDAQAGRLPHLDAERRGRRPRHRARRAGDGGSRDRTAPGHRHAEHRRAAGPDSTVRARARPLSRRLKFKESQPSWRTPGSRSRCRR